MGTIGERIRELRTQKKMSLQELADVVGKSKGNISGYENNKYEPSAQTIISICSFFEVSADWLLSGVEAKGQNDTPFCSAKYPQDETEIISIYGKLDDRDREDILDYVRMKYDKLKGRGESLYSTYGSRNMGDDDDETGHGIA